jgi:hypothetical protein
MGEKFRPRGTHDPPVANLLDDDCVPATFQKIKDIFQKCHQGSPQSSIMDSMQLLPVHAVRPVDAAMG